MFAMFITYLLKTQEKKSKQVNLLTVMEEISHIPPTFQS